VTALGAIEVKDVPTAVKAINLIIRQGEGTPQSPTDAESTEELAHYYRFEQLVKGMKIVPDAASPCGFSFDPHQPITIDDTTDVVQMVDDPQLVTYDAADAEASQRSDACDTAYSQVIKLLDEGFNGHTNKIGDAIKMMKNDLEDAITALLGTRINAGPYRGMFAGPRFRYIP
jgi:hypothetical protein